MEQTRFGAQLISVRESEDAAEALPIAGRKRLEIARAWVTDPVLLLLDEVMAGLNPAEITEIANRAYVLENGVFVMQDTPAALLADDQLKRAYFGDLTMAPPVAE